MFICVRRCVCLWLRSCRCLYQCAHINVLVVSCLVSVLVYIPIDIMAATKSRAPRYGDTSHCRLWRGRCRKVCLYPYVSIPMSKSCPKHVCLCLSCPKYADMCLYVVCVLGPSSAGCHVSRLMLRYVCVSLSVCVFLSVSVSLFLCVPRMMPLGIFLGPHDCA